MIKLLRFADLRERGVVDSWAQLRRLIDHCGFPQGRMLSPNQRTWDEAEIDAWYAARPTEGPEPRGAAKEKRDRARKKADSADVTTTA
jgi:hypothetical protein